MCVFCQKHANSMHVANSEDPDQTAPLEAVLSGSALFAQTYLSENLGSFENHYANMPLQYTVTFKGCKNDNF